MNYIICPYTNLYYKYFGTCLPDGMLKWFPIAPDIKRFVENDERNGKILINGHIWKGEPGFRPYKFRTWAQDQPGLSRVQHNIVNKDTPCGMEYPKFLAEFSGAMALCDLLICPKYSEIPMAGCVTFAQYHWDYEQMGFKDMESCIYVTKGNFKKRVDDFNNDPEQFKSIAVAGQKLMAENYTSKHFADFIRSI